MLKKSVMLATCLAASAAYGAHEPPTVEELWTIIQKQQKEIEELKAKISATERRVDTTEQKVEAAGQMVEQTQQTATAGRASWADNTRLGSYGELHYNNLDSAKVVDFARFVLLLSHEFSDRIRFFSEVEIEHAVASSDEKDPGEVELEQAYLDYRLTERHTARAGLYLIPVGILNETHEPTSFYGVERNPVETFIIPTTWREAGLGVQGEIAPGWGYNLGLTTGLKVPTTGPDAFLIPEGKQEAALASADSGAVTGRLKWTGIPGLELAATLQYQGDVTQGQGEPGTSSSAILAETHVALNRGPFGFRALYARWNLDGSAPEAVGRNIQSGWYIEPSYKPISKIGLFARYNEWDNEAGLSTDTKKTQTNIGVNYWPIEDVVLKFDLQWQGGAVHDDGFNLGLGYQFN
jgi:hypothetical protein